MRGKRKDIAQADIERGLAKLGISFADTSALGKGFPDLVIGYQGSNYLYEVKNTAKGKLTPLETNFQEGWQGQYKVVWSIEQILEDLGL